MSKLEKKKIDLNKLDEELIEIYNSSKRPNKALEKRIIEVVLNDSD